MGVQARVRGPHPGIRLAHRSDGVFHRASSDGVTAGRDSTGPDALGKELEEGNGIAREVMGIDGNACAEGGP